MIIDIMEIKIQIQCIHCSKWVPSLSEGLLFHVRGKEWLHGSMTFRYNGL